MLPKLDPMPGEGGGGAPASDALTPPGDEGKPQGISIPADMLPEGIKPGDSLTVKSVEDGVVSLEHKPGEETGDDWGESLVKAAPRTTEGEQ